MTINNAKSKPSIGFIGLGNMGNLMVQRLLQADYQMTVYDRTKEKTQEAVHQGAKVAYHPRDLAETCDVVMSMVSDNHALEAIMHGPDGALAAAKSGTIFIDLSTVSPENHATFLRLLKRKMLI